MTWRQLKIWLESFNDIALDTDVVVYIRTDRAFEDKDDTFVSISDKRVNRKPAQYFTENGDKSITIGQPFLTIDDRNIEEPITHNKEE